MQHLLVRLSSAISTTTRNVS